MQPLIINLPNRVDTGFVGRLYCIDAEYQAREERWYKTAQPPCRKPCTANKSVHDRNCYKRASSLTPAETCIEKRNLAEKETCLAWTPSHTLLLSTKHFSAHWHGKNTKTFPFPGEVFLVLVWSMT
ncbi:hypothetical protein WAI453_007835 [Rhynchosporium graminicola]